MKAIEGNFESRELTCSVFTYSLPEFKKLKASKVVTEWLEDLDGNSSSYPTFVGSPFDTAGIGLPVSCDEEPQEGVVYVIPHYFYESAEYAIEESIDKSFEIKLAPIVGILFDAAPMDWAEKDGVQAYFEGVGASDGTEPTVNFYYNGKLLNSALISDLKDDVLKAVAKSID